MMSVRSDGDSGKSEPKAIRDGQSDMDTKATSQSYGDSNAVSTQGGTPAQANAQVASCAADTVLGTQDLQSEHQGTTLFNQQLMILQQCEHGFW